MSTTCTREELLKSLESVQYGLSPREAKTEQGDCFAFQEGKVITFNGSIACVSDSPIKGFTCAVRAKPLLVHLSKFPDGDMEIVLKGNELIITGKESEGFAVTAESKVSLQLEYIEQPDEFHKLPSDFLEALTIVQECAGKDSKDGFIYTCIHIHPERLEACDGFQLARYSIKTGVKSSVLISKEASKVIVALDMSEIAVVSSWVHFRNASGLVLSCLRYIDIGDFPDFTAKLEVKGEKTVIPAGLEQAVIGAELASRENVEQNYVRIELKPGKMRVRGEGMYSRRWKILKVEYDGPHIEFRMSPRLLIEVSKHYEECYIASNKLSVSKGPFSYAACLYATEESKKEVEKEVEESNNIKDKKTKKKLKKQVVDA